MQKTPGPFNNESSDCRPEEASALSLTLASADALAAEFRFRPVAKEGNAIPFLYKFVDYLSILLHGSYDISLCGMPGAGCVSTNAMWHIREHDAAADATLSLCETPPLHVVLNRRDRNGTSPSDAVEQIKLLVSAVRSASTVSTVDTNSRKETEGSPTVSRLTSAWEAITAHTKHPRRDLHFQFPSTLDVPDPVLKEIIRQTATRLNAAWSGVQTGYWVAFRYYRDSEPFVIRYAAQTGLWDGFPADWENSLKAAILTGFTQVQSLPSDRSILFIPCHFGGTPWLVMCYECFGHDEEAAWASYRIYRDLGSRINTAIRLLGQASYGEELKRIFSASIERNFADPNMLRATIAEEWAKLGTVYPISPPTLGNVVSTMPVVDRELILRFPDGEWALGESREINPFVRTTPPFEQEQGESWSASLGAIVKENFIKAAAVELRVEQTRLQKGIASASYLVGHSLIHRLSGLRSWISHLCKEAEARCKSDLETLKITKIVWENVKVCAGLPSLMNFISAVSPANKEELLDRKFLTVTDYVIDEALPETFRTWVKGTQRFLAVEAADTAILRQKVVIVCFPTRWGRYRPYDVLYDELFFEVLFNAAKFAERVHVNLDTTNPPALIFRNEFRKEGIGEFASPGEWEDCRRRSTGGLRFLADCLAISGSGALETKIEEVGEHCIFHVKATLQGLSMR